MTTFLRLTLPVLFCLLHFSALLQTAQLHEDWWTTNGQVAAMKRKDNTVYIGGMFTRVGPVVPYGTVINASCLPDTTYDTPNYPVHHALSDGAGGWYICGSFSEVGGQPRNGLAHLDATGSVTAWNPNVTGTVLRMALSGTKMYIGGTFTTVGGQPRANIAAVDLATGNVLTWNPSANGVVNALAISGNVLYAGGQFTVIGGANRNRLAALDLTADTNNATSWFCNANDVVYALILNGTTLYVGGQFTTLGPYTRNGLAAVNTTAYPDNVTAWNPSTSPSVIMSFAVSGTTIYVGGYFTTMGGQTRRSLAALNMTLNTNNALPFNPSGSWNATIMAITLKGSSVLFSGSTHPLNKNLTSVNAITGAPDNWTPDPDNLVRTIATDGVSVYIGGDFSVPGGVSRKNAAALDIQTGRPTPWDPQTNQYVREIEIARDTVYLGGDFSAVGASSRHFMAAVNSSTGQVLPWIPEPTGSVMTIIARNNLVHIGGSFWSVGWFTGPERSKAASLYKNLNSNNATSWNPEIDTGITSSLVSSMLFKGDTLVVCGKFSTVAGQARNGLAAFDINSPTVGLLDWNPGANSGNWSHDVERIGNTLYTTGTFTSIGGQPRTRIAALDLTQNTNNATSWHPVFNSSGAIALAKTDSLLYCSGSFTSIDGQSHIHLAAIDTRVGASGTVAWDPGLVAIESGPVEILPDTTLFFLGGTFKTVAGKNHPYFAVISPPCVYPSPAHASGPATASCVGTTVTLSATGALYGGTWTWYADSIGNSPVGTGASIQVTADTTRTYYVRGENSCTAPGIPDAITVQVHPMPEVAINGDTVVCLGEQAMLTASGTAGYSWSGGISNGIPFFPAVTQQYTVTGTDANGCSATASATVTVNALPGVSIAGDLVICQGDQTSLSGLGANSYAWSGGISDGVPFVPAATQQYTVTGTDTNGCSATVSATVTVNALPGVSIAGDLIICQGDQTSLSGLGANSYAWSGGISDGVPFVPASTQQYMLTGTGTNGCSDTVSATVTVLPLPAVTISGNPGVCDGDATLLSGNGASDYLWSGGISDGVSFVPLSTQSYTVTGTDANGCSGTAEVTVTVYPLPVVMIQGDLTVCAGEEVMLSGNGADNYLWSGGISDGMSFTPDSTQAYTVTGTDVNGCSDTATAIVTVNPWPTVTITGDLSVCAGEATTLYGNGAEEYAWSGGISDGVSFGPDSTQTYIVTGTDANGCSGMAFATVTVYPLPVISVAGDLDLCAENPAILSGNGAESYVWSGGILDGVPFFPTSTQQYTVTGTDANGCLNDTAVIVTVYPLPIVVYDELQAMICMEEGAIVLTPGNPAGGTYYVGIDPIGGNVFDPQVTGEGTFVVTYEFFGDYGCTASDFSSISVESCLGLKTPSGSKSAAVYPNPFRELLTIELELSGEAAFTLYDGLGKIIRSGGLKSGINQLDLRSLATGVYLLRIESSEVQGEYRVVKD